MMAEFENIKIAGLDQLAKSLRDLPQRIARNVLAGAVYAGSKVIRDEARLKAPVAIVALGKNAPPPGTLRRAVIMKRIPERSNAQQQTYFVTVRHGKKYQGQGKKGTLSQDAWYWRFVEFGSAKKAARPFLRPAFEQRKVDASSAIQDYIAARLPDEIEKLKS
jgi:HK97 gp10 family phage protein